MPFNSTDFTKAPWAAGIMTLTHEECLHVLAAQQTIRDNYDPADNYNDPISDSYVQAEYNKIDWKKGVNGETFAVLMSYDPEVNTLGINEQGIVKPEEPEPPAEEPTNEVI